MQTVFDLYSAEYDKWFEKHESMYLSELEAVCGFVPVSGVGLDVGAGTGRFSLHSRVVAALDPSLQALKIAASRGLTAVSAVAERLPFR